MASKKPEGMVELNGYIPKELKREFKTLCTAQEKTMGEVLTDLIQAWVSQQKTTK